MPLSGLPAWTFVPSVVTSELLHCALCWADGRGRLGWVGRPLQAWVLLAGNIQNGPCGWVVRSGGGGAGWGGEAYSKRSQAADRLQARQGRWGLRADHASCADPWRRAVQEPRPGPDASTQQPLQLVRLQHKSRSSGSRESLGRNPRGEAMLRQEPKGRSRSARKPDLGLSSCLWDASQTSCFLKNGIPTTSVAPRRQQGVSPEVGGGATLAQPGN